MDFNTLHTARYTTPMHETEPYRTERDQPEAHQPTTSSPVHRTLLVVDIENSTGRHDPVKAQLRQTLYRILDEALHAGGIAPRYCDPIVDRGDGALVLIRPADHLPKSCLFTVLVPMLDRLIEKHNEKRPALALRVRIAVHAGEIHHDEHGPFGEAIDLTCRLLDSPELKTALRQASSSTVLAVSEHLHEVIIKHQYDGIDATAYSPRLRVDLAGTIRAGWLRIEPHPAPAQFPETIKGRPRAAPFRHPGCRTGQIVDTHPPDRDVTYHQF